VLILSFSNCE